MGRNVESVKCEGSTGINSFWDGWLNKVLWLYGKRCWNQHFNET